MKCIFLGYVEHSKGYRFLVIEPNDSISVNTVIKSTDVEFCEGRFQSIHRDTKELVKVPRVENQEQNLSNASNNDDEPSETRRNKRRRLKNLLD